MLSFVEFCLPCWLLLIAVSSSLCGVGEGKPVSDFGMQDTEKCLTYSMTLLRSVTNALDLDELFRGFNCSEQSVELNTWLSPVCQPNPEKNARCTGLQIMGFNQNDCLRAIWADLQYYKATLLAYQEPDLMASVLEPIQDLMEHCNFPNVDSVSPDSLQVPNAAMSENSFYKRLHLCKVLRGFQVRAVTVNRIMGYVAASRST